MLSSRKTLEPRSLQSSTPRTILLNQSRSGHRPPSSLVSFRREFSWGSKHKYTISRAGKVCKGFSTRDSTGKDLTRKQLYWSAFWGNSPLRRYLPRYAPVQEWRSSSSWGKKPETASNLRNKAEANEEEEDWYTRWEKQKLRQYDAFMKKVEHDPYTALFGNPWLNFGRENGEPRTNKASSPKETSVPKDERTPKAWPYNSRSSCMESPKNRDVGTSQSKSETMPMHEHDQEYEIDPITNRKVLKASASTLTASTSTHDNPQAEDGRRASEPFFKRWNLASRTPLDRRFIIVEHGQVLSSYNPSSNDTPSVTPHDSKGWLAQEGFGKRQEPKADPQQTLRTQDAKPKATATKIESALDRHLSRKSTNENNRGDRPQLQYKPEENKAEDVDLLRPSDVRASAGLRGNSPKETEVDKQARRKKLEEEYESCSLDGASQLAGEAASNNLVQKREDRPVQTSTAPELRFGSWLKGTFQDEESRGKEASQGTSAVWVNEISDAKEFDALSVDRTSDSTPLSKNESVPKPARIATSGGPIDASDKASRLKAQIVPFKARLDAMKADYDFLRQEWLHEIRRLKEKAAKEEDMKAQKIAKRAREIHEEEIKSQKVAMEAMEMRSRDRTTNTAKTALAKGIRNDDAENPAPRRLQSFLQGEGDMASNVHEFAGRDRWYKRKAPHAMDAKDAEMDARLQRLATDRALIRDIRGIYEDTYGTIDTKHRQSPVPPTPSPEIPVQLTSSGSIWVQPHGLLPSDTTAKVESSKGLDEAQISDALKIIQKLFAHLREAQSIIQDYQSQTRQALDSNGQCTNMITIPDAFKRSVMQILGTSMSLDRFTSRSMISRRSVEASAATNLETTITDSQSTNTAIKPTNLEVQKATKLNTYCILVYDSASESVKSVEATTHFPFSKEESLLPLDALNRLSNPGKFLRPAMSLGDQGYEPVSATSNILVFKKEFTPQELAETKETGQRKDPNPILNSQDHSFVIPDNSVGSKSFTATFDPSTKNNIPGYRLTELRGTDAAAAQRKIRETQKPAVYTVEQEHEKVERTSKTVTDGITREKQPFEEAQEQQPAFSASPSQTSSDTVRRQERVFSGSRHGRWGRWPDNSIKYRKSKRAAGRRRKGLKRVLMAGAFTAACCYCVGVASEMMHSG